MEIKQVTINLTEETIRRLEKKATQVGTNLEALAADLVCTGLNQDDSATCGQLPGVAMLKDSVATDFPSPEPTEKHTGLLKDSVAIPALIAPSASTPENLQRKAVVEAKMQELALVIETASEADREKYALQYAILAAELNSLL